MNRARFACQIAAFLAITPFVASPTLAANSGGELLNPSLVNGSFESADKPLDGWRFASNIADAVAETGPQAHSGKLAAHVREKGGEWTLTNEAILPTKPGEPILATAYLKGTGDVRLELLACSGGQPLKVIPLASERLRLDANWVRVQADATVPPAVEQVQLRFSGLGTTDAWIDDVSVERGARKRTTKPPVQGFATQRVRENLDRGLVAIAAGEGRVYLSWRLLDTDPPDVAFNVYRQVAGGQAVKISAQPVAQTTDFLDASPPAQACEYTVRAIVGGSEQAPSPAASVTPAKAAMPYRSIALGEGVTAQKVAIADLDGDGKLDLVVKTPNANVDPYEQYWQRSPGTYKLQAYRHDGTHLWTYDLGWSIEQGVWYSPYVVYDFDGDGRAEVAVKVGEGDPRDPDGRVTSGNEYVAILDGRTGKEITRAPWPSREGYPNYNYYCRNQLGVAYLDGKTPALIVERGTYNTIKLVAYQFHDGRLTELWHWQDTEDGAAFRGQGAHRITAADLDGDGRDKVIIGSAVIGSNGNGLWSTRMGHPDQVTVGQLDPSRPGLQLAYGLEIRQKFNGVCMVDGKTGQVIWGLDRPTLHIHSQGLVSDIDARHPGVEVYGGERDDKTKRYLFSAGGKLISDSQDIDGLAPRAAYWDATPQRELLLKGIFTKFDTGKRYTETKIEGTFVAVADVDGDWREEVFTTLPGELRIYHTTIPAAFRHVTLMRDPIYRMDVASSSEGYYQMPSLAKLIGMEGGR